MKSIYCVMTLALLIIGTQASAQTRCPMGAQAGSIQCLPDEPQGAASAPQPTGRWHKTWGALAINEGGDIGFAMGRLSKEDAESLAVERCEGFGSGPCKGIFDVHNSCVAVAAPTSGAGGISSGDSKERASGRAMTLCEKNSGQSCRIVLSACSDPIFEKF
ncbi:DUF4189 domain-containing protein [Pseudomonas quasicaspiana]|uniref:DUF4189 domain-containing protein n=1 Tax=Pseudomonas quasicaspiana TaxID=2829821 RepID=UPI001E4DBD01|nr:DUF4189 domain-containing protein [Pseudomonas quasicaspiana]MCD5979793.1 DUF4189 domain-containing protein [Pseudomonas quasicaspiana]